MEVLLDVIDDFLRLASHVEFANVRGDVLNQLIVRVAERSRDVAMKQREQLCQVRRHWKASRS